MADDKKIYAHVDYEDTYVQPLLIAALKTRLPPGILELVTDASKLPTPWARFLQWRQYESVDIHFLTSFSESCLANTYLIRKALIRKHYLSATVAHWLTKNPDRKLKDHVKPSVEFEVDYAEFLDDALVEAYELKESWERNEGKEPGEREWWILKPGMSERGQGIRLFSSEEELTQIFEEWDPPSDDEEEDEEDDDGASQDRAGSNEGSTPQPEDEASTENESKGNGIITSQLRHFVAQPYIHPPLLLPDPHPSAGRKFHIRTYVLAVGALKLYVYKPMLALFAAQLYAAPSSSTASSASPNDDLSAHLTNTCLQTGEREGSVHAFWSLSPEHSGITASNPSTDWREDVFEQICTTTASVFEAAARSMSVHFQCLPNAFEIFGLDFLVDAEGVAWLLEVNAFPDFAQTGGELQSIIKGLFEGVVDKAVLPFFAVDEKKDAKKDMIQVLDIDLGRR